MSFVVLLLSVIVVVVQSVPIDRKFSTFDDGRTDFKMDSIMARLKPG